MWKSLSATGQIYRPSHKAGKIAITGSVGKTGTKDMIAAMLATAGETHATKGNLNNHLGVPLTLTNMAGDAIFCHRNGNDNAGECPIVRDGAP